MKLKWKKVDLKEERYAVMEAVVDDVRYEISPNQRYLITQPAGFVLSRNCDNHHEGYIGEVDNVIGVCCGFALYSAIGVPKYCVKTNIKELKSWAKIDVANLKTYGKDNFLVDKYIDRKYVCKRILELQKVIQQKVKRNKL